MLNKMKIISDLKFRTCLEWTTERPFKDRPRESPMFYYQGSVCSLVLSFNQELDTRYFLKIKSNSGYHFFKECNVIIYLKGRSGRIWLSRTSVHKFLNTNTYLWNQLESDISKLDGNFDSDGLLRFVVSFDNYDVEKTLGLMPKKDNEKSVQASLDLNPYPCLESLSGDFSKLLDDGSHCDVELKCENHTIKAHKVVLSSRSEVFKKMLQSDMAEGLSGVVEIQDMDYGALVDFLRYLYTGKLPELTTNTAIRLYEVGDKYAVGGLIKLCACFLIENLEPKNACSVLILADKHSDVKLKNAVIVYILTNKLFLNNDAWPPFCHKHPNLAVEVLNRFASCSTTYSWGEFNTCM